MSIKHSGKFRVRPAKWGRAILQEWVEEFHPEWPHGGELRWGWRDVPYHEAPAELQEVKHGA